MRPFHVATPEPLPPPDRALGRLGPFLLSLARTQGAWPPQLPQVVRRVADDAATFDASTGTEQAFEAGVLLNAPQVDALRFMPALNVTKAAIAEMIDCLEGILTKAGAARLVA